MRAIILSSVIILGVVGPATAEPTEITRLQSMDEKNRQAFGLKCSTGLAIYWEEYGVKAHYQCLSGYPSRSLPNSQEKKEPIVIIKREIIPVSIHQHHVTHAHLPSIFDLFTHLK